MARRAWDRHKHYRGRQTGIRDIKQRFLIVCEGEKTEPNYFRSFRVPTDVIVDIEPGAGTHRSVVEKAIKIINDFPDTHDQIWCVFDRDDNGENASSFNEAILLAKSNNIMVAYSNDAFELWYLLHFNYHDTAIHRHDYISKLNDYLGEKYKKNDTSMYKILEDKMSIAERNARKLSSQYEPKNPERDNPSTTVHLLVEQLKKFL